MGSKIVADHGDPYPRFLELVKFMRGYLAKIGGDVFIPDYKWNRWLLLIVIVNLICYAIMGYTYYEVWEDREEILACTPVVVILIIVCIASNVAISLTLLTMSFGLQQTCKVVTMVYYSKEFYDAYLIVDELFRNCKGHTRLQKVLHTNIGYMEKIGKIQIILYFASGLFVSTCPIVLYLVLNQTIVFVIIRIPYCDLDTWNGFFITNGAISFYILSSFFTLYSVDFTFLFFCLSTNSCMDLLRLECDDLKTQLIKSSSQMDQEVDKLIRGLLVAIIKRGLRVDRFAIKLQVK